MPELPATEAQVEASAAATIEAAAITLETVQAAIEAEGQTAEDRQEELLEEVRKCLAKLEALSASMERGAESPSLQQLLLQVGQMQTALEAIQTDLAEWKQNQSRPSNQENGDGQEEKSEAATVQPGPQNGEQQPQSKHDETSQNPEQNSPPPESNQSATPSSKRRRYVKI